MVFDSIDEILKGVAHGDWSLQQTQASSSSMSTLIVIIFIICIVLYILTVMHRRKGTFVHPKVSPEGHATEIAHMIDAELQELYTKKDLCNTIMRRTGGMGQAHRLHDGRITSSDLIMKPAIKMWYFFVAKYDLDTKENVAKGKFGKILINKHFFTLRTLHHHYAMAIAAQLFFLQVYAISGKDPREIQAKESYMKKAGELVLAKAGKLEEYAALSEKFVWNLAKHDRKIDEELASLLGLSGREIGSLESKLEHLSRSIHDMVRLRSHLIVKEDDKIRCLIDKELSHLKRLVELAEDKKGTVNRLSRTRDISPGQRARLGSFLNYWDGEIARLKSIVVAIEAIKKEEGRWKFANREWNNFTRGSAKDSNEVANLLLDAKDKKKIDMNKVHAILTSFTAAKANMICLIDTEERTL